MAAEGLWQLRGYGASMRSLRDTQRLQGAENESAELEVSQAQLKTSYGKMLLKSGFVELGGKEEKVKEGS